MYCLIGDLEVDDFCCCTLSACFVLGQANYRQETLASSLLQLSYPAHDAEGDVMALAQLLTKLTKSQLLATAEKTASTQIMLQEDKASTSRVMDIR